MVTISINPKDLERAKELYDFGHLNNSMMEGSRNIVGAIGEVAVNKYLQQKGYKVDHDSSYYYDLTVNGRTKIEVKTASCKTVPQPNYACNIIQYSIKTEKPDYYAFVRYDKNLQLCYLLGYISGDDFMDTATVRKKGSMDNGMVIKETQYTVKIKQLNKF